MRHSAQLALGEEAVDLVHVDVSPALLAVQERIGRVFQRRRLVKAQNDAPVLVVVALQAVQLPPLALVAAQVIDIEGTVGLTLCVQLALHLDEPLAAGVDGVAPQVHPDPAPPQLLGHRQRRTGTAIVDRTDLGEEGMGAVHF
ncbi:MAG: hypothetical protein ACUVWZ_12890, partial [Anaerolineae bacterium]